MASDDKTRRARALALQAINRDLARQLAAELPKGHPIGWLLLTFDFGEDGFMTYASNAEREGVIAALEEMLAKLKQRQAIERPERPGSS